ncbi:dual specificity protein phosphatase [Anaeramoeba ignava]|uniref:protein-tyrosine-phosphatase n=1 Tax=Anaeramoeba ignava TaxID=1746090 RepID=A0A9Q0L8B4_ANAIG|nr:dual specificity protein phosphatase [Anaeramoeba ignava]
MQFESFNQILPNLFLGPRFVAEKNIENLIKIGITHILNVTKEGETPYKSQFTYKTIKIEDDLGVQISDYFDSSFEFIDSSIKNNGKVYVHCDAGISRSPTIIIYYLMKSQKKTLKEAFDFVKERRTAIRPNISFFKQLLKSEVDLFGFEKPSISEEIYAFGIFKDIFPSLSYNDFCSFYEENGRDILKTEEDILSSLIRDF